MPDKPNEKMITYYDIYDIPIRMTPTGRKKLLKKRAENIFHVDDDQFKGKEFNIEGYKYTIDDLCKAVGVMYPSMPIRFLEELDLVEFLREYEIAEQNHCGHKKEFVWKEHEQRWGS